MLKIYCGLSNNVQNLHFRLVIQIDTGRVDFTSQYLQRYSSDIQGKFRVPQWVFEKVANAEVIRIDNYTDVKAGILLSHLKFESRAFFRVLFENDRKIFEIHLSNIFLILKLDEAFTSSSFWPESLNIYLYI